MAFDLVGALIGWLVQRLGDAGVAGVVRAVFGDAQERALRGVLIKAIKQAARTVGGDQHVFLERVLLEHLDRLADVRHLPDLPAAVRALVASLDAPGDPHLVAPLGLAEELVQEITVGVLTDASNGGPLLSLVTMENFAGLFALSTRLQDTLETVLARITAVEDALGDRSVPITINIFSGAWQTLERSYLDPTGIRERVLSVPFTGRAWLVREIADFLSTYDHGYFVIQADAGTGKTAFALWYSGLDSYPIHFTSYSEDARSTASAVRNITAQLIAAWGMDDLATHGFLPAEADWYSWLRQVMEAAARRRDQMAPARKIVLVIDGLDEAVEANPNRLPLGLPDVLPPGVYVVATTRTGGLRHQPSQPMVVCDWNRRLVEQRADLEAFLNLSLRPPLIQSVLADGLTEAEFVSMLADRCGDVWLYLHYVLAELATGTRRPREVPRLPRGLDHYYHNTIERLCQDYTEAAWRLPLLATLAVATEPMDAAMLSGLAGVEDVRRVGRFLDEQLRPFCVVSDTGEYGLKHSSFGEYLAAGPDPAADLVENVRSRWRLLAAECQAAHRRICDRYLTAWGGLEAHLPALAADPALAQRDTGYPLRALATHLVAAGRDNELHRLLGRGSGPQNVWYAAHEAAGEPTGFLRDVAVARRALGPPSSAPQPDVLALKARYALVEASIAAISSSITPDLLGELVRRGWTITRAFAEVERITDLDRQAESLLRLAGSLPDELIPDAWRLAVAILDRRHTCGAITALIPRLPQDLLDDAIRVLARHEHARGALAAAAALVPRLPEQRLGAFAWLEMPTWSDSGKTVISSMISLRRGDPRAVETALDQLVEVARGRFVEARYLAAVMPLLPDTAFGRVMALIEGCPGRYRSDALIALARYAPAELLSDVIALAADVAWEATPPEAQQRPWLHLMHALGPRLNGPQQVTDTVAVALALYAEPAAEAITALAPSLNAESARQALRHVMAHWTTRRVNGVEQNAFAHMVGALIARLSPSEARAVAVDHIDVNRCLAERPDIDEANRLAPFAAFLSPETVRLVLHSICNGICLPLGEQIASELRRSLAFMAPRVGADQALLQGAIEAALDPYVWRPDGRIDVLSILAPGIEDDGVLEAAVRLVLPGSIKVDGFTALASLGRALPEGDKRAQIGRRALDLAFETAPHHHRVQAVAALAPGLPPALAVEALEFVGSMTRRVLWGYVLSALDALAPQLPETELPRALEILKDIPMVRASDVPQIAQLLERLGRDDRTRALGTHLKHPNGQASHPARSWLWAIAPFLSAPLAEQALAAAREEPDYARRVSLAALAPRLPHTRRAEVAHEVLGLLDLDPDDMSIRVAILARLMAATTMDEVISACRNVVATMHAGHLYEDFNNRNSVEEAWTDLLAHIPDELIEPVLAASNRMRYLYDRCRILVPIMPRLPQHVAIELVGELETLQGKAGADEQQRLRAIVALSERISDDNTRWRTLGKLLDRLATGQQSWYVNGPAFIAMIGLLPPHLRDRGVELALDQAFDNINIYESADATALLDTLDATGITMAFKALARVSDPSRRARTTVAVLRRAGLLEDAIPRSNLDVLAAWRAAPSRSERLALVGASAWWIYRHGGRQAVEATANAIFDVCRWWR